MNGKSNHLDEAGEQLLSEEILDLIEIDYDFHAESTEVIVQPNASESYTHDHRFYLTTAVQSNYQQPQIEEDQESRPQDQDKKRSTSHQLKGCTKVAKLARNSGLHDVRQIYAQMFMNCVNSGDTPQVQSYLSTFMSESCNFVLKHTIDPVFGIPPVLASRGPGSLAHYIVGCYATFPDMVLNLRSYQIITSTGYKGTKIVMDTEAYCTKIYDLADYSWAPEADQLSDIYRKMSLTGSSSSITPGSPRESTSPHHNTNVYTNRLMNTNTNTNMIMSTNTNTMSAIQNISNSTITSTSNSTRSNTRYRSRNSTNNGTSNSSRNNTSNNTRMISGTHMAPPDYVQSLIAQATLLPVPHRLYSVGKITLFLDENHCMQQMVLELAQRNHNTSSFAKSLPKK